MTPRIHSLHVYPIKSCQGIDLKSAELTPTGFSYDRHWMLVDKQGQFLTQRQLPQMALIKPELTANSLIVSHDSSGQIEIPLLGDDRNRKLVNIWNDRCNAAIVSTQASQWFSTVLDTDCDLVFMPPSETRQVDQNFSEKGQIVGFADGFPLLLLSLASIDLLNEKMQQKIKIDRFRANIIIDGCTAHAEDHWSSLTVNGIVIRLPKPCSRCVIPSIHQHTAEKHPAVLKTLASYRRREGKVYMGQNGLHLSNGQIDVGQPVEFTLK